MTKKKLRDFLAQADPPIDIRKKVSKKGKKVSSKRLYFSSDRVAKWPEVANWSPWNDFTKDTIETLMGPLLDEEFDFPEALPYGPDALLIAANEPAFQFEIVRHNNVIVNTAVQIVSKCYPGLVTKCWASGYSADCDSTIGFPDFSTIPLRPDATSEDAPDCICPGDTKFYDKLEEFPYEPEVTEGDDWAQLCLRQVCHYAFQRKTRYFYLLTPEGAIIGRRSHSTDNRKTVFEPEIIKVLWKAPEGELNVNTALIFISIIAGLDHDVHREYESLEDEYKAMFRNLGPPHRST